MALLSCVALWLRSTHLEDRPMHTDEAVHAVVLGEMLKTGVYRYNPHDTHGPTLYYLSYPILRLMGLHDVPDMNAWHIRMISALVGAATVLSLVMWSKDLGANAVIVAGTLMVFAAPFVYYQRYFIHEGLFVALTLALLHCCGRLMEGEKSRAVWICTGVLTALLFATKETASLVVGGLMVSVIGLWLLNSKDVRCMRTDLARSIALVALAFLLVFVLLYSSFGTNFHGLIDALKAIFRFAHRAGGEGHEKPWWTYLTWLFAPNFYAAPWSGWIIFGLAATGSILDWNRTVVRLLLFFTLAQGVIYSAIPYKTPWLELNILAPACLLAGVGAASLWQLAGQKRPFLILFAVLALLGLGRETMQTCFAHPADARNPLAYSPTSGDIENLVLSVAQLKTHYPDDSANFVQVISPDYWPLPWYLRRLQPVGYWSEIPPTITGDIVITSPDLLPAVMAKLGPDWKTSYFGLRSDVLTIVLSKPVP